MKFIWGHYYKKIENCLSNFAPRSHMEQKVNDACANDLCYHGGCSGDMCAQCPLQPPCWFICNLVVLQMDPWEHIQWNWNQCTISCKKINEIKKNLLWYGGYFIAVLIWLWRSSISYIVVCLFLFAFVMITLYVLSIWQHVNLPKTIHYSNDLWMKYNQSVCHANLARVITSNSCPYHS